MGARWKTDVAKPGRINVTDRHCAKFNYVTSPEEVKPEKQSCGVKVKPTEEGVEASTDDR